MNIVKNSINAWVTCLTVSLFFFYEFFQATMLDSISRNLLENLQCSALELANISASYFYANVLFLIPAGMILDRFNVRIVTCSSIFVSIMGVFLLSSSTTINMAEHARFISGISGAFCFLCCLKVISCRFTFNKFPYVIGVLVTIAFIGGIVSHLPFAILTNHFGWRNAVKFFGFLGVLILVLNFIILGQDKNLKLMPKSDNHDFRRIFKDLKSVILNRYTWTGGMYTALLNLPVILLGSLWSGLYLVEIDKLNSVSAATVTSGMFLGLIIGSPIIGFISKNQNVIKKIMILGSVLSLLTILSLMIYDGKSREILFLIFFLLGFFSSSQSLGYSWVISNVSSSITSLASSVTSMIVLGGGAILKILFGGLLEWRWSGTVIDNIHIYSKTNFDLALSILPVSFLICMVLPFLNKKNLR